MGLGWVIGAIGAAAVVTLLVGRLLGRRHSMQPTGMVGPYVVDGVLGSGAASTVYRGRAPQTGATVAVKVFDADAREDPRRRAAIREEVAALRALTDPNCVRILDVVDDA